MPKVSVIIPAYNAMSYLPITVDSVFQQTFSDFELIVVNDGSSDHIEQWANKIKDARFKFISQANQGPAVARNTGIAHAQGEYIAFLDADDLWDAGKLEKQVHILDANPDVGLVYSWVGSIDDQGKIRSKVRENYPEEYVWEQILEHNIMECGSNPMTRRICFENVGSFDPILAYAQDWDMWLRIAYKYKFQVIKEPLVYYRDHPNNRSKNWQVMEKNYHIIFEKSFADLPQDKQHIKNRSYGFANLRIAWKILQSPSGDYQQARYYFNQGLNYYPQLKFSPEYLRFNLAIMLVRFLGINGYKKIRDLMYSLKSSFVNFSG